MVEVIKAVLPGIFLLAEGIRDLRTRRISMISVGIFSLTGLAMGFIFNFDRWYQPLVGTLVGSLLLLIAKITEEKIGYGDGWVMLVTGIYLGFRYSLFLLMIALGLSSLAAIVLLILKKANRKSTMPFVPFVFVGYCIMLCGVM